MVNRVLGGNRYMGSRIDSLDNLNIISTHLNIIKHVYNPSIFVVHFTFLCPGPGAEFIYEGFIIISNLVIVKS